MSNLPVIGITTIAPLSSEARMLSSFAESTVTVTVVFPSVDLDVCIVPAVLDSPLTITEAPLCPFEAVPPEEPESPCVIVTLMVFE